MPSLPQLPEAISANPTDKIMLDQSGTSRAITVATLQTALQPKLTLAQGALLGRVSPSPGLPEPVGIGSGRKMAQGAITADTAIIAPIASPAFTGTPTAPTPSVGDSSTTLATTAFVQAKYHQLLTLTGDLTGTTAPATSGTMAATLAAITTPGQFTKVTVNAKGQVTGGTSLLTPADITGFAAAIPVQSVAGRTGVVTDLSQATILATGTPTTRALADRAADNYNVLDFGADRTGAADSAPALAAIAALTGAAHGGTVYFPTGTYKFNSYVYFDTGVVLQLDSGTKMTGTGAVIADNDASVLMGGRAGMAHLNVSSTDANFHSQYISHVAAGSSGGADYEKSGLYVGVGTYDQSTYTHGTSLDTVSPAKDLVAIQATANIYPGNTVGRAAAITTISAVAPGADGSLGGIEVDMVNNGVGQSENNRFNTKTAYNAVANGPNAITNAYQITAAGGTFFDGYCVLKNAVTRHAFSIRDLSTYPSQTPFTIDPNGNLAAASLSTTGTLSVAGNGAASSFNSTWTAGNPGNGAFQWNFTGSVPSAAVIGPLTTVYNNGPHCAQAEKFQYFSQAGAADSVDNAQTLIGIYNPGSVSGANMGAELVRWTVGITPQDTTHNWTHVVEEYNVVNRGLDMGWKAYRNDPVNNITGPQQITGIVNYSPEATGLGQPGEGKNLLFAELFGQSAANNASGMPSRFYNASLYEPNCVVGGTGRAIYINGDLTGITAQIPYAPLEINLTWLHGLRTTTATFQDGQALTMATGQSLAWSNGTSTAKIQASGSGANQDIVLSPTGTGSVRAPSFTATDSTGITLATGQGGILQIKDNGAAALSKLVVTPGNGGAPAALAVSGEANQGLNIRSAGTGQINFQSGSGGSTNALTILPNATAVNALSVIGGSTGQNVALGVNGADTNVSIQISPQGTGSVAIAKLAATGGSIDGSAIGATTPGTGAFTTLKSTSLASFTAGLADASYSSQTPTTGFAFAITIANGVSTLQLTPAGTLAAGTITMPSSPGNGQWLLVASTQTITACTFTPASGQTILGGPTTLPAYVEVAFQYQTGSSRWVCQSGNDTRVSNVASAITMLFGTGADGTVSISSGTTTLTRDMHYAALTLSGTGAINTAGYRLFVAGTLDLSAAGTGAITLVAFPTSGSVGGGVAGASAPTGGVGAGGAGTAGQRFTASLAQGGDVGAGGTGGAGTLAGGTGGAANTAYLRANLLLPTPRTELTYYQGGNATLWPVIGGLGGASGGAGGGDATNSGGAGGTGGNGSGIIDVFARFIQRGSNATASLVQAKGASGSSGASSAAGNTGGGGGGSGGGGGMIRITTEQLLGSTITNALDVSGGIGGTGGNGVGTGKGGTGGTGGSGGNTQLLVISAATFTAGAFNTAGSTATTATTTTGTTGGTGAIVRGNL